VGPKGIGKTSLATWIAARASRGDALLGGEPLRVYADSCEDEPAAVLRPRLEAAGGDLDRIKTREPQPTRGMVADAKANGISGRTLERARATVKCQSIHPKRLRERLGDEAYDALPEDQKSARWVALPELPDAPPAEWTP